MALTTKTQKKEKKRPVYAFYTAVREKDSHYIDGQTKVTHSIK